MKMWVTSLCKPPLHAEVVAEGERDLEWLRKEMTIFNHVLKSDGSSRVSSLSSNPL